MRAWLTEQEACKYVGKTARTLRSWREKRIVNSRKRGQTWEYEVTSLVAAREQMEWNYRYRRIVPGTGRGRRKPVDMDYLF